MAKSNKFVFISVCSVIVERKRAMFFVVISWWYITCEMLKFAHNTKIY